MGMELCSGCQFRVVKTWNPELQSGRHTDRYGGPKGGFSTNTGKKRQGVNINKCLLWHAPWACNCGSDYVFRFAVRRPVEC